MAIASSRIAFLALAVGLGACAPYTPYMGEALKYDMAMQTVDPDPVYPAGAQEPGTNGDAARAAAERYRKGTVKPVERESTMTAGGSGGSSGSR